jgi:cytochrome c-type biogenesis protein CcmH
MYNHIAQGAVDRLWREGRWQRTVVALCIALVLVVPAAQAQENPTPTLDQIQAVARELYCPLCNGVRLDNCDLQACVQMRQQISDRLAAGVPKEQIKQEFVAQYGPVVLGEPPREGLNWLVWLLPVVALIGGAVWIFMTLRGWTKTAPAAPAGQATAPRALPPVVPSAEVNDDYLAQVDADLERLD